MAKKIVIATGNQGKVREMINAFKNLDVELISLKELPEKYPEPVEDGDSFQANSLLKAKYYCEETGLACLADDSGLEVEALNGAPGIYSARYAGEMPQMRKIMPSCSPNCMTWAWLALQRPINAP